MKYVKYTLIDRATGIPVSQRPARAGTVTPTGVTEIFFVENSFQTGVPVFYGKVANAFSVPEWMESVELEDVVTAYKAEVKSLAKSQRDSLEFGGIEVNGMSIKTAEENQTRLSKIVLGLQNTPSITSIEFTENDEWLTLPRDVVIALGEAVTKHVQSCYTWASAIDQSIKAATTVEEIDAIRESIVNPVLPEVL